MFFAPIKKTIPCFWGGSIKNILISIRQKRFTKKYQRCRKKSLTAHFCSSPNTFSCVSKIMLCQYSQSSSSQSSPFLGHHLLLVTVFVIISNFLFSLLRLSFFFLLCLEYLHFSLSFIHSFSSPIFFSLSLSLSLLYHEH